jgi:hypothetical protein
MNQAIHSFLKFVPSESWIVKSSHIPWLDLDLDVPGSDMLQESATVYGNAVTHRSQDTFAGRYSHEGWKSLTIFGESSVITEDTQGPYGWTDISKSCPITVEFLEKNWLIDDNTGRIRFMWLEPQGYILPHQDRDRPGLYETNIALNHPPGCVFRFLDKGTVPFYNGSAVMVDISNRHLVVNDSLELRTHLIVHAQLKPGIIKKSYAKNFYS